MDLRNIAGNIRFPLRNDMMFHYTMQNSPKALKGLICALKSLNPDEINEVVLNNPIDFGNYSGKEVILDIKVVFNSREMMDIELQMYNDSYWKQRSLLYLCRAYDSIGSGDKYKKLMPTTLVAIMSKSLFPDYPEFYSKFLLMNTKYHYPYTTNFALNVLDLSHIELATEEDHESGLFNWSKMFLADTWEEIQQLAQGDDILEEVVDKMYMANTIPEERTLFEAHQKYVDTMNTILSDKEEAENSLSETKSELILTQNQLDITKNQLDITSAALNDTREKNQKLRDILIAHGIDPDND